MQRYGFNKMEKPLILQKNQLMFFQRIWFLCMVILDGQHIHLTFHLVITKAAVYKHWPTIIDGMKVAIRQTVKEIPQEMTRRVMENFRNRLQQCMEARGRHLEDVIFENTVHTKWQSNSDVSM